MEKYKAINLAQQALDLRVSKANKEIKPILEKYEVAIGAMMQYRPEGIIAVPTLLDNENGKIGK